MADLHILMDNNLSTTPGVRMILPDTGAIGLYNPIGSCFSVHIENFGALLLKERQVITTHDHYMSVIIYTFKFERGGMLYICDLSVIYDTQGSGYLYNISTPFDDLLDIIMIIPIIDWLNVNRAVKTVSMDLGKINNCSNEQDVVSVDKIVMGWKANDPYEKYFKDIGFEKNEVHSCGYLAVYEKR